MYTVGGALFFIPCVLVLPGQALAQFQVQSPEIDKSEFEFDYQGGYFSGLPDSPNKATGHGHEPQLVYSLTGWLSVGVEAAVVKDRADDGGFDSLKLSEIEIQSMIELVPLENDGAGLAFYVTYGESLVNGEDESEVAFGPIIKVARGPLSATVNLFALRVFDIQESNIDDGEVEIERLPNHWNLEYAWQAKRQITDVLAFGVEGYGDFMDINKFLLGEDTDRHRLGPMLCVTLGEGDEYRPGHSAHELHEGEGPEIELTLGVLFGLTGATSDVAFKWGAEFEF